MKIFLLLGMVCTISFAQPYANPMAVQDLVKNLDLVGKTVVKDCDKVQINEICETELKKSLSITENTDVFILKPDMPMMHEFSPLRVYVQVDKNNKIQRAGL
jgi:hypothetical protein